MKLKQKPSSLLERLAAKRANYTGVLPAHLCLVDLKADRGREDDWNVLHARLVLGLQLARSYFNAEAVSLVFEALQALTRIHATAPGRESQWFVTPAEASLLGMTLVVTDEMEGRCTRQELHLSYAAASAQLV